MRRLASPLHALIAAEGRLFVWLPVMLALGIGGYFALPREPAPPEWAVAGALALLGAALWRRGPDLGRVPALAVALVATGFCLAGARAHLVHAPVLGFRYYGPVEGRIVAIDRSSSDALRITLDRVVLEDVDPARTPLRVRIALRGPEDQFTPEPGLPVRVVAGLAPPEAPAAPGGFDFTRHAWFQRLGAVGYTREVPVVLGPPDPSSLDLAGHRARMRVSAAMQERIPGQPGAVAAALITGDRSGITEATNTSMRASNLYHIISISGLHMGLLAGFVFASLRYGLALIPPLALRLPVKKIAAGVALAVCTFYLWLAGPNVATERAWLMAAVMLIAVIVDRQAISLRSVALSATILLVLMPESLTEAGFQMSYAATVALVLVFQPWSRWREKVPAWAQPLVLLVLTSLIAGLATAPFAAAHFNRLPQYGLLANVLASPAVGILVMPAGVIAALLAPFGLEGAPLWVMEQGTRWLLFVSDWVAGLDGAVTGVRAPPGGVLAALSLGALVALVGGGRWLRLSGAALGVAALAVWGGSGRPMLLISADAALIGVMGPEGRALSRPRGAGFAAETWLEDDGDTAVQKDAAARPGIARAKGWAEVVLGSVPVRSFHGKGAEARAMAACAQGGVVVLAGKRSDAPPPETGCLWLDERILRRSGALALRIEGARLEVLTAVDQAGRRLWNERYWKWGRRGRLDEPLLRSAQVDLQ